MNILDILFPRNCLECKKAGEYICRECLQKVGHANLVCPVCRKHCFNGKTHSFCTNKYSLNGMHSFYKYEGIVRKAILKLKYNFASSIAEELIEACSINPSLSSYLLHTTCYLIPIPLHKKRHNWRGFNQAVLIGKKLSENSKWDFEENLLLRVEDTTPQVRLDKKERLQNIRGKFAVNNETLSVILERADKQAIESQPTFIVFDDVWTTGATINEAGKVLKKAGAKVVWGMSVARS